MRPRLVLIILVITLAFLLVLILSPGFWHRKELGSAVVARHQNPTPENIQALEVEQAKAKREQYVVCSLLVVNFISIIIYGAVQQRKGTL